MFEIEIGLSVRTRHVQISETVGKQKFVFLENVTCRKTDIGKCGGTMLILI